MTKTFPIVMLPTEKASNINLCNYSNTLSTKTGFEKKECCSNQHLYILSDEEIPYNPNGGTDGHFICLDEINQNKYHNITLGDKQYINPYVKNVGDCKGCRKIVATTDKSLTFLLDPHKDQYGDLRYNKFQELPKLPESFIQSYIKAYNEGKPITEVDLEMELEESEETKKWFEDKLGKSLPDLEYIIKTRPDNTVIIKEYR